MVNWTLNGSLVCSWGECLRFPSRTHLDSQNPTFELRHLVNLMIHSFAASKKHLGPLQGCIALEWKCMDYLYTPVHLECFALLNKRFNLELWGSFGWSFGKTLQDLCITLEWLYPSPRVLGWTLLGRIEFLTIQRTFFSLNVYGMIWRHEFSLRGFSVLRSCKLTHVEGHPATQSSVRFKLLIC